MRSWREIPSFVSFNECIFLQSLTRKGDLVIDVGVGRGRSALAMAFAGAKVVAVSLWNDSQQGTREEFRANVKASGLSIFDVECDSAGYARRIAGMMEFDMAFIDCDHAYEHVKADMTAYGAILRDGGILAFHDVSGDAGSVSRWAGVDKAVAELEQSGCWQRLGQVENTAAFRKGFH